MTPLTTVFTPECLSKLFPVQRTDAFFEALFGDVEEGAYDIRLVLDEESNFEDGEILFFFELHQRPGRCLVCSLTYGLPQVFERHPIINLKGLVQEIAALLNWKLNEVSWKLGPTESISNAFHRIPLVIFHTEGQTAC